MNDPTDDIIRSFLNLHPDTPIDGTEFALPLRMVKTLVKAVEHKAFHNGYEAGRKDENEACVKVCKAHAKVYEELPSFATGAAWAACDDLIDAIRARREQ